MKIEPGKKIKISYELAVDGGDVIESSAQRGPLEYIHGAGQMLPGLESRTLGMTVGDERTGVIPAAEAYGTEASLPTRQVGRDEFPENAELEVGLAFQATGPDGNLVEFRITEIDGDKITVRFVHPLAGKDIRFEVKVLEISDA
ncbi:MAG: peptidylprolyl isomerase [Deltaproteobacteria bacterium]|nr:peptidylprolyl isomerase [Deltaproteobacteria bacterium]